MQLGALTLYGDVLGLYTALLTDCRDQCLFAPYHLIKLFWGGHQLQGHLCFSRLLA